MKNLFLPYELALIAKEKGFDEPCFGYYNKDGRLNPYSQRSMQKELSRGCTAPIYQQIIDWFREKYNLDITPQYCMQYPLDKKLRQVGYGGNIYNHKKDINVKSYFGTTYYEALNFAIQEAFKLI